MKNKLKEFFRPTVLKIIIFVILILLTIFIPKKAEICGRTPDGFSCGQTEVKGFGYPLFLGEMFSGDARNFGLNPLTLLINIVIFYSISCEIVILYSKIKKK
ncbi:MAG: hypothetical protein AAB868_01740 [Patescibacteria group bacterium]